MSGHRGLAVSCVGVRHVSRVVGQDVIALDGIDLCVEPGSTTAVVGPSGSGKSTLLTVLAGLQRPSAGTLTVGADDLATLSESDLLRVRADHIGVVVQNPVRNLLPFLDAADNIGFAQRGPRSYSRDRPLPEPRQLLADLGLAHLSRVRVDRLSGGERQRLALAVGMAGAPGVLLADEPTSQLDTANRDQIVQLLQDIRARYGTTVIAVTHDPDVAAALDRCVGLHEGRVTSDTAA
jgi:ABC-type lipoprotein export system ATPase subunit